MRSSCEAVMLVFFFLQIGGRGERDLEVGMGKGGVAYTGQHVPLVSAPTILLHASV